MPNQIKFLIFSVFLVLALFCPDHSKADIVLKADQHIGDDSISTYTPEHPITNDQIEEYPSHFHLSQSINITKVEISGLEGLDGDKLRVYIDEEFVAEGTAGSSTVDFTEALALDGNKVHTIAVRARCFDDDGNLESCSSSSAQDNDIAFSKITLVCDGTTKSINRIQRRHIGDSDDYDDWYYDLDYENMAWYPDQNNSYADQTLSIPFSVNSRRKIENATFFRFRDIDNEVTDEYPYPEVFIDGDPIGTIDDDEPTGSITIPNIDKTIYAGTHTLEIEYQCSDWDWSIMGYKYCDDWDDVSWDSVIVQSSPDSTTAFCPSDNLFSDSFEDGDLDNPRWSTTGQGKAEIGVNEDTAGAGSKSMFLANGTVNKARPQSSIDLSGFTSANLSIWIRRGGDSFSGYPEAGQNLILEYQNSTNKWENLKTFQGGGTPGEVFNLSYSLPEDALHRKFNIKFRLMEGSGSRPYYWHVDNVCLSPTTGGIDHFAIIHDGHAVNCQRERVTIEAQNEDNSTVTDYTGTISLSTSTHHGDWSKIEAYGNLENYGSGNGEYTFSASDNGKVALGIRNTYAETVDIDVTDGSISEDPYQDPPLVFQRAGFEITNSTSTDPATFLIDTQISSKPSYEDPNSQDLQLMAVNSTNGTSCQAALNGTVQVKMAFECIYPDTCSGRQVEINGTNGWQSIQGFDEGNVNMGSSSEVSLDFGDETDATAAFDLNYPDAGKIKLHARYELEQNGTPSGNYMYGASNEFVVRPFGFHVSIPGTNSSALDANDSVFQTAGANFTAKVTAKCWESNDDTDQNGIPDGHEDLNPNNNADLSDNLTTPNFGQEINSESVELASYLWKPDSSKANDPELSGSTTIPTFKTGNGNSTGVQYPEVGIIGINATIKDGQYLDIGFFESSKIIGSKGEIGRFIPNRFRVTDNSPEFGDGCSGFTYMGQQFPLNSIEPRFIITAKNANNQTTQNYDGNFWKLPDNLSNRTYKNNSKIYANATNSSSLSLVRSKNGSTSLYGVNPNYNGTEWITLSGDWLTYQKPVNSTEPFQAKVNLNLNATDLKDTDGVCYDPDQDNDCDPYRIASINGTELRYGRIKLFPAYGSELLDLDMEFETQYYNSTLEHFTRNKKDNCTQYYSGNMTCSDPDSSDTLDCSEVNFTTSNGNIVEKGEGHYTLSAPGKNNTGTINCILSLDSWLGNSTAPATFGIYKGNEHIIYQQETTWK